MYPDVAALVAVVWPQDTLLNAVMLRTLFYLNLHREVEDLIDMDISEVVQHAVCVLQQWTRMEASGYRRAT